MFDAAGFVDEKVDEVRDRIDGRAIIACSGGVDSVVATVLVSRAIGDRLLAVYVDTGLMRKGETDDVCSMLESMDVNHRLIDASDAFFGALEGVTEPEEKRKRIGETFIRTFESAAREFDASYLVQGTIAPDWIESGDEFRDTIKSHHNVGGLPEDMELELVEPLRDLYKDEVRKVARHLEIAVSERQPFPGPALAIRVIGEANPESVAIVREACDIVEKEIEAAVERDEMDLPWQYFAVLLNTQSVGVQGDRRAYGHTVAVRSVSSIDGMTAMYSHIPHSVLSKISSRITNAMNQTVNRVVYDITDKPPATVEWE